MFRDRYPTKEVYQLALQGVHPGEAIKDLLNDETFNGVVLCSIFNEIFARDTAKPWTTYYQENWNWNERLNWQVRSALGTNLIALTRAVSNPLYAGLDLFRWGSLPGTRYDTFPMDRDFKYDFQKPYWRRLVKAKVQKMRRLMARLQKRTPAQKKNATERALTKAAPFERLIKRFQERGGTFVYLYLPDTLEGRHAPIYSWPVKETFWDPIARVSHASMIHFLDIPGAKGMIPVDASHLDVRDALKFTNHLIDYLAAKNLLN